MNGSMVDEWREWRKETIHRLRSQFSIIFLSWPISIRSWETSGLLKATSLQQGNKPRMCHCGNKVNYTSKQQTWQPNLSNASNVDPPKSHWKSHNFRSLPSGQVSVFFFSTLAFSDSSVDSFFEGVDTFFEGFLGISSSSSSCDTGMLLSGCQLNSFHIIFTTVAKPEKSNHQLRMLIQKTSVLIHSLLIYEYSFWWEYRRPDSSWNHCTPTILWTPWQPFPKNLSNHFRSSSSSRRRNMLSM